MFALELFDAIVADMALDVQTPPEAVFSRIHRAA
jgi:hypothetical protein